MKIIVSQEQIDKMKSLIDKVGINSLGIEPYKLIEMGLIESYDGSLDLYSSPIESLGNLKYVGGDLNLYHTPIKSLGNLKYVGGDLYIMDFLLSKLSDEEIRSQVEIKGKIYR